ncbi:class I SAM-dependent methyltransferase [Rhizorhapis suberifaciens]|nr:class I SAM-dependent methyltransferase [Rhizorhapis suberifaciens]
MRRFSAMHKSHEQDEHAYKPHWETPVPTLPAMNSATIFNGFAGAYIVQALERLDVWSALQQAPQSLDDLAARRGTSKRELNALLRSAALLGYVNWDAQVAKLTDAGESLVKDIGFFIWGVGGYGPLLHAFSADLNGHSDRLGDMPRNGALIAKGAGQVGTGLMLPIEQEVISGIAFSKAADIGCGDGTRLIRLINSRENATGIGIDINQGACDLAVQRVREAGLEERLSIHCENIVDALSDRSFPQVDLVCCFLMMHDLFATSEDKSLVVRTLRTAFPDARHFLIADTVVQPWSEHKADLPIFSLQFELVHSLMDTPLYDLASYRRAFEGGGLRVVECRPFGAPSTWLFHLCPDD